MRERAEVLDAADHLSADAKPRHDEAEQPQRQQGGRRLLATDKLAPGHSIYRQGTSEVIVTIENI